MVNPLLTMSIKVNVLCICRIAVRSTGDEYEEASTDEGLLELGPGLRLEQRRIERLKPNGRFATAVFQPEFKNMAKRP
jgi:hypothetical protein